MSEILFHDPPQYDIMTPIKLTNEEIVDHLEKENKLLRKSIENLKQYYGVEYLEAVRELETYLIYSRIEVKEEKDGSNN